MNHTHNLGCDDILRDLNDYIDGELDPKVCEGIEAHLQSCPNCKIVFDTLEKTIHLYQVDGESTTLPEDVRQRLFTRLELDNDDDEC